MERRDQQLCEEVLTAVVSGGEDGAAEVVEKMNADRKRNVEALQETIDAYGWPTVSAVGDDGAEAAWIIAQHADHDPGFQESVLTLMRPLLRRNEVPKKCYAYLSDRVAVNNGRPQPFGTQFLEVAGRMVPRPIMDRARLNRRRTAYGLEPFEEYDRRFAGSPREVIRRGMTESEDDAARSAA
ncbi:MAG: hypothetical protein E6J41_26220 [Chloroflexi bacterium]|nr:MAG: hypothetical protein E6J41_26220 [Chloroflexota bacterium]